MVIDISKVNKARLLAGLYNSSKPLGMGIIHYDPKPMLQEEAAVLLEEQTYFDYLKGRVMKVDLSKDTLDTWGYDRDNGEGAAQAVVDSLN